MPRQSNRLGARLSLFEIIGLSIEGREGEGAGAGAGEGEGETYTKRWSDESMER